MAEIFTAMGSALYSQLAAGAALTTKLGGTAIYQNITPVGISTPYVIFSYSGGGDDNTSPRRARSPVYTVKVVTADTDGTSGAAFADETDALLDALLHSQTLTVTGWGNYATTRVGDIAFDQEAGGVLYYHRGGQYRVRIAE